MFFWEEDLPQFFADFSEQMTLVVADVQESLQVLFDVPAEDSGIGKGQMHGALSVPVAQAMAADVQRLGIAGGQEVFIRGKAYNVVPPLLPTGDGLVRLTLCEQSEAYASAGWR